MYSETKKEVDKNKKYNRKENRCEYYSYDGGSYTNCGNKANTEYTTKEGDTYRCCKRCKKKLEESE